jgi:hypothetical protein
MRRLVIAAAVTSVTATAAGLAFSAGASPLIPLNERTEGFLIHEPFHAVQVSDDFGSITVTQGSTTKITAAEGWNVAAPTVTAVVHNGVLNVDAVCSQNYVEDAANDCSDDLALVLPSNVDLLARAQRGNIVVTNAGGKVDALSYDGTVTASHVQGPFVQLHSDTNNVTARDIDAPIIVLTTSNGQAKLTNATSHNVRMSSEASNVIASHVQTDTVEATSTDGQVQLDHSSALVTTVRSTTGAVTVNDVTSPAIGAASSSGIVSVECVHSDNIAVSSDSGDVQISTYNHPSAVAARSSKGAVFVDVPHGAYAINATSGDGKVTMTAVNNQPRAKRHITAHSDTNNVTINGH